MVSRDDIRKLIGGYATGTLTESERKLLFDAALEDQDLFDELAREQDLKAVLDQPGAKQRLIASLTAEQGIAWWRRPLVWSAASGVLVATLAIAWMLRPSPVIQVAGNRAPMAPPPSQAANEPAPVMEAKKAKPAPLRDAAPSRADSPGRQAGGQPEKDRPLDQIAASSPPPPPKEERAADKKADSLARSAETVNVEVAQASVAPRASAAPKPAAPPPAPALSARLLAAPTRFAFDYSLEDQQLVLKFAADGYFSIHFSPGLDTIVDSSVTSGMSRRLQIPNNATEATIVFSARPQTTSGGVTLTRENKIGTATDPSNERIELLLKFYP